MEICKATAAAISLIAFCNAATAAVGTPMIDPRVPPLFTGHVMTNETVLFMGTDDAAPLMYKADKILSVKSFDLKTEYREGEDWTFDAATRTIRPTPGTKMPYYTESEWYPARGRFKCNLPGKPFVFFSEGSVVSLHQVCVTYSHSDSWDGPAMLGDASDFVLIAFGMNDSMPASAYSAKTEEMVKAIHSALPNAAVMLVPPMEPNPEAKGFAKGMLFSEYERALYALADKFRADGFPRIGCANVNTMHAAVLGRKRYRDMTGNNINHCNDFSARIYRDAILTAMGILPVQIAR